MDYALLVSNAFRFLWFVRSKDNAKGSGLKDLIDFNDTSGYLGAEENYKSRVVQDARAALCCQDWEESWIGSGRIAARAKKAIGKAANLVNSHQQIGFRNKLDPNHPDFRPEAELALYNIYRGADEEAAFNKAIEVFGAKYDLIAFLFFVKNENRFLPVSPDNFDRCFPLLGISFSMSHKCSWDNYRQFNQYISDICEQLNRLLPLQSHARLIDAHSFVWIIHEKKFLEWQPTEEESEQIEREIERRLQEDAESGIQTRIDNARRVFARNAEIVRMAKNRANGVCQLCQQAAPFKDKKGQPFLEVHHIKWLSEGGKDSLNNVVALCPNCHAKIHIVNNPEDTKKLELAVDLLA